MPDVKKFICKYCKVQVLGRYDWRPVLGEQHKRWCPRHNSNTL